MPSDVKRAFIDVIATQSGRGTAFAEEVVGRMGRGKRYVVEAWN
jgi:sulfite reductase alpha subunit-like flavoprotein